MSLEATEKGETWRHRAGDHGKMEADPGATYLRRMLRISRSRQEPGEGHGADCPSGSPGRSRPCRGLGVRLLAHRTERTQSCCFKPPPFAAICDDSPRSLTPPHGCSMAEPGCPRRPSSGARVLALGCPGRSASSPVTEDLRWGGGTCMFGEGKRQGLRAGVTQSCRRRGLAGPAPTEGGLTSGLCRTGP